MTKPLDIGIIGFGNVGSHLASRLTEVGMRPSLILTSNPSKIPSSIADEIVKDTREIDRKLDMVFTTVSDDQIEGVFKSLEDKTSLLVHCSGSTPLITSNTASGVMYPLQTFTAGFEVNWEHIPIFIESSDDFSLDQLSQLAANIGGTVIHSTTEQRKQIHLAGVIGNNFTNHLLQLTGSVLNDAGQSLDVIKPLIEETLKKAFQIGPSSAQTGPASRGDVELMDRQLQMLDSHPELKKLYLDFISSIQSNSA